MELEKAVNKQVETMRALSELRHKTPARLKTEWLDREHAKIDAMMSDVKKHAECGIVAEIEGSTIRIL